MTCSPGVTANRYQRVCPGVSSEYPGAVDGPDEVSFPPLVEISSAVGHESFDAPTWTQVANPDGRWEPSVPVAVMYSPGGRSAMLTAKVPAPVESSVTVAQPSAWVAAGTLAEHVGVRYRLTV